MRQEIISETECQITEQAVKSSSTNVIPANNVVIATRVGLGKVCFVERDTAINQDLRGIIPIRNKELSVHFLFWWFKSVAHLIEQEGTGATVQGVKLPFIKSLPLPLPTLPEQKRIVAILNEAFEGIDVAVANAEKNLANARELFDSHLNSVFTQKGEGWLEKKLEAIGRLQTGTTPKTSEKDNLGTFIPFIKPGDFKRDGSIDYENEGLSELGLKRSRLIQAGSALMVCIGATIGKAGFVLQDISANQQVNAITPSDGISGKFLYYQMISERFQKEVMANSAQATLPIINKTKWGGLSIFLPKSLTEQERIVFALDELSIEAQRLEGIYVRKLAALAELKQAILQKAFAGELTAQPEQFLQDVAA
jgi:type I restriction enzyme, S subunit